MPTGVNPDYPILDCEECSHRLVCKNISVFVALRDQTDVPIDWDSLICTAFTKGDSVETSKKLKKPRPKSKPPKDNEQDDLDMFKQAVEQLVNEGKKVISARMSKKTQQMLLELMTGKDANPGDALESIKSPYGDIQVITDNRIAFGLYYLIYEEDGENNVNE